MISVLGTIFDIQHFSLQDGPGIRSTVFFKGCPLRCRWCSNPESQLPQPQFLHYHSLCRQCGACVETCPQRALSCTQEGNFVRNDSCNRCEKCVEVCRWNANALSGRSVSAEEVCEELLLYWRVFVYHGGGITCSGGEPLAQPQFLKAILSIMHDSYGIDTCIETSGFAPWEVLGSVLPHLDRLYFDIKHMDDARHREGTGVSNAVILENAAKLATCGKSIVIRTPLIPGFNDTEENMEALGVFMASHGLPEIELMPQHVYGKSKYAALGRFYDVDESAQPQTERAVGILRRFVDKVSVHEQNS